MVVVGAMGLQDGEAPNREALRSLYAFGHELGIVTHELLKVADGVFEPLTQRCRRFPSEYLLCLGDVRPSSLGVVLWQGLKDQL